MRINYISWAPHCSRSDHTARELGGTSHMVYWGWLGSRPATVWLKYLGQMLETWKILMTERPDVVFVMTPPPVAICAVYAFCVLWKRAFVVDAHTGAFLERWRHFQNLQSWLCRRAAATIVSTEHWADYVGARGGRPVVVPDVPIGFEEVQPWPLPLTEEFVVVCAASFDRDEPIEAIVEAAWRLPDVRFLLTGDSARGSQSLTRQLPPNLTVTGFLDTNVYGGLLQRAGVVLALTTAEHTMQRAAYEAVYQGTPVIVSDTALLRKAFDEGAVHVANSGDAIAEAVVKVRNRQAEYREGAKRLSRRMRDRWVETKATLLGMLGTAGGSGGRDTLGDW